LATTQPDWCVVICCKCPVLTHRVHVASTDVGSKVDDNSLWGGTVQADGQP
jgi:hypothetical protein